MITDPEQIKKIMEATAMPGAYEITDKGVLYHGLFAWHPEYQTPITDTLPIQFDKTDGFSCAGTPLVSLEGLPSYCNGRLDVSHTKITSLQGASNCVIGNFACDGNLIEDLRGAPNIIWGNVHISCDSLKSLDGIPRVMKNRCYIWTHEELSLVGIHEKIDEVELLTLPWHKISEGGLGLIMIPELRELNGSVHQAFEIIEKYLGKPDKIFDCQQELIDVGYDKYAVL